VPAIVIDTIQETRENIIVRDKSTNNQYRFGMPASTLSIDEYDKCLHALETIEGVEFIVVSGSLPPGVPGDIFSRLSEIAKGKKAKLVIDVPGEALVKAFKEKIFLLKPNLAELSSLAGMEKSTLKMLNELQGY
jgi:6-phosphofructokinase 2